MATATLDANAACARCGVFLKTPRELFYSSSGSRICGACHEREDLEDTANREARTVRAGGYTGPMLVVASVFASFVFGIFALLMMAVGVLISGTTLWTLIRDVELRGRVGLHAPIVMGLCGLATLIGGGFLALAFLGAGLLAVFA